MSSFKSSENIQKNGMQFRSYFDIVFSNFGRKIKLVSSYEEINPLEHYD